MRTATRHQEKHRRAGIARSLRPLCHIGSHHPVDSVVLRSFGSGRRAEGRWSTSWLAGSGFGAGSDRRYTAGTRNRVKAMTWQPGRRRWPSAQISRPGRPPRRRWTIASAVAIAVTSTGASRSRAPSTINPVRMTRRAPFEILVSIDHDDGATGAMVRTAIRPRSRLWTGPAADDRPSAAPTGRGHARTGRRLAASSRRPIEAEQHPVAAAATRASRRTRIACRSAAAPRTSARYSSGNAIWSRRPLTSARTDPRSRPSTVAVTSTYRNTPSRLIAAGDPATRTSATSLSRITAPVCVWIGRSRMLVRL